MSSDGPKSIFDDLAAGLAGGAFGFLRAGAGAFAAYLVIKLGAERAVNLVASAWLPTWGWVWNVVLIGLFLFLCFGAFFDGFTRPPARVTGLLSVPLAFIEKLGTTIVGLLGGTIGLLVVELLLYAVCVVALGGRWRALTLDPNLRFIVRFAAPLTFFFGTLFAASFAQRRLRISD